MRLLRIIVNILGILLMPIWALPWVVFIAVTGDSELNRLYMSNPISRAMRRTCMVTRLLSEKGRPTRFCSSHLLGWRPDDISTFFAEARMGA